MKHMSRFTELIRNPESFSGYDQLIFKTHPGKESGCIAGLPVIVRRSILFAVLLTCTLASTANNGYADSEKKVSEDRVSIGYAADSEDAAALQNLPPVAICRNIIVQLTTGGSAAITGADIDGGSYDPDGTIMSLTAFPNTFTCSAIGPNTVTLTVTDNLGLTAICNATVTVQDRIIPTVSCRNITVPLDNTGMARIVAADVINSASDNCPGTLRFYLSRTTFSCSDIGSPVPVTLTATDASGNTSTCMANVTVVDNIAPKVNLKTYELVLGADGTGSLLPEDIDNGTYDNCGALTLSVTPDTFSCSDLGEQEVTLTATDSHGNSSSGTVNIMISSTLQIKSVELNNCYLTVPFALFSSEVEGGEGPYSYFWKGISETSYPFLVIIQDPPALVPSNTSNAAMPFFNNATMPDGTYGIRLVITDANGCTDTSEMAIQKTGTNFNNLTYDYSEACLGDVVIYSVDNLEDAIYDWDVTNGTILNSDLDTSRISVLWDIALPQGVVTATIQKEDLIGLCQSSVIETVTINPVPVPEFINVTTPVCSDSEYTYTLTQDYDFHSWTVTGGRISAGGASDDNYVTILWDNGPAGNVSVSVANEYGCPGQISEDIVIHNLGGTVTSLTDISCNGAVNGTVTVTADAGSGVPPYEYSLDGGAFQLSGTFTGIPIGNHSVTIEDALGCTYEALFTISQPPLLSGTIASLNDVNCFGGTDGIVTINASGGMSPYTYSIDGDPFSGTNVFAGLSAGSYVITIRDNNNCETEIPVTVTQPSAPLYATVTVSNVLCYGNPTGGINLTVTGGTLPYTYLWSNGAVTEDLINIPSGTYNVTVTDANGCTTTSTGTVTQPPAALTATAAVTNVLCNGNSTGTVNLTVTGGTSPYAFLWSNGATSEDLTAVEAGSYSVTVTDANNCTTTAVAVITEPEVLSATAGLTHVLCFGESTGGINLVVTGGVEPYTFLWSNGASSEDLTDIPSGTYTVTITDANGCTTTSGGTITQPAAALAAGTVVTNVLCYGNPTGGINLTVTGGTLPYIYLWSNGAVTEDLINIPAGIYNVTITDANGCTTTSTGTVTQPSAALAATAAVTDVLCNGNSTGTVNLTVMGGTSPYAFLWSNGATSEDLTAVEAGSYSVTVTDANNCTTTAVAVITEPEVLSATAGLTHVLCFGESTGGINLVVTGGVEPYTFLWSNGASSEDLTDIPSGTYTVTITDANGCTTTSGGTITQPAAALAAGTVVTNVLCYGNPTGGINLTVTGGTLPYIYLWSNGAVTEDLINIPAGIYNVTITDANGCTTTSTGTVTQPSAALAATAAVTDVLCNGNSTGTVNLTVTGGTSPYTYLWSNGAITEDLTDVPAGTYSVTVTDAGSCTTTSSATVSEPEPFTGTVLITSVACFGESNGSVNLTVAGGTSPYTFIWSNGEVTEDISDLLSGLYSVTVKDANDCEITVTATVTQPVSALGGNIASQTDVSVWGGSDGTVTVEGTGGTAPYLYRIGSGEFQSSGEFGSLAAGIYSITIQDVNLCTFELTVTIIQPDEELTANIISQTNVSCNGESNGSVTVEGWGGTIPFEYSLNSGTYQESGTFSSLAAGTYTITVRDAEMSTFDIEVIITEPDLLAVTTTSIDNLCFGGLAGSVSATVTGGTAPFSYSWNTTPVQTTQTATGLPAGTYHVAVTDFNGCTAEGEVIVGEPENDIIVETTHTDVLCFGGSTGSASATASEGAEPYSYSWNTIPVTTTETVTGLSAGTYIVTVTDLNGCSRTASVQITEPDELELDYVMTPSTCPDINDGNVDLTITGGTSPYSVIWSDYNISHDRPDLLAGSYTVVVTDQNDCAKSLNIEVETEGSFSCVEINQVITPNNDNYNDEWTMKNIDLYPDAEVLVFNRWGRLVFRTKNISANPWDGRLEDGTLAPTDSYHYILYLNDGSEPRSGVISVIR